MRRNHTLQAIGFLLGVVQVACDGDSIDCTVDDVFTAGQQDEIQRAADAWNAFTVRPVRLTDDGDWLILPALVPGGWLGYSQPRRRLIRVSPMTPDDQIYAVALHELGHALGLRHVSQGVMDPTRQTVDFSEQDMAECRRVGAC